MTTTKKPPKLKRETYDVDGVEVVLIQAMPDLRRGFHGRAEKAVRSQWEIHVAGELRGYAVYPLGVGQGWRAWSLVPREYNEHGGSWTQADKLYKVWKMKPDSSELPGEAWYGWEGRFDKLKAVSRSGEHLLNYKAAWTDRESIARAWPDMIARGVAPSTAEVEENINALRVRIAARKREEAQEKVENEARWAREEEERKRQAAEAERVRLETLEALASIRVDFHTQLSNLQAEALSRAIVKFGGDPNA